MPFSASDVPSSAKNLTGSALTRFVAAANTALRANPDDEGAAIAIGLAAAKKDEGSADERKDAGQVRRLAIGDSARVYREDRIGTVYVCDLASLPVGGLRGTVSSTTGFLHVRDSRIARSGTLEYSDGNTVWTEFRSDSAIDRGASSFSNIIFTNDHPPVLIDTSNVADFQAGQVGQVVKQGMFMVADEIVITRTDAIERAQRPGGWELSIGFLADVVRKDGTAPDGTPFQFEQLDLEGNHLAGVEHGRAGPECRLAMDSAFSVSAIAQIEATLQQPETSPAEAEENPMTDEEKKAKARADAKIAASEKLKADAAMIAKAKADDEKRKADAIDPNIAINERCAIIDSAKTVVGRIDHSHDNQTLMLAVIAKVHGEDAMKSASVKSPDYVRATFDAAILTHEKSQRIDTSAQIAARLGGHRMTTDSGDEIDLNKIHAQYRSDMASAHHKPPAHTEPQQGNGRAR